MTANLFGLIIKVRHLLHKALRYTFERRNDQDIQT